MVSKNHLDGIFIIIIQGSSDMNAHETKTTKNNSHIHFVFANSSATPWSHDDFDLFI